MRFILAAVAFVLSLACFGLAGWQIAEAQSADSLTVEGTGTSGAPLLVIPSDTLVNTTGSQSIEVSGEGPIVAVVGREGDVAGWVDGATHDTVVIGDEEGTLVFEPVTGEPTAPNPLGSDLWYEEYTGEGQLEFETTLPPGFALLVASDGEAPAPAEVTVTWPLDGRAPWSGPLLVAGIVLLLIALGLLLWALLILRRERRPRRAGVDEGPIALTPSTSPLHPETGNLDTASPDDAGHDWSGGPDAEAHALAAEPQPEPGEDWERAEGPSWSPPGAAWAAPAEPASVHDTGHEGAEAHGAAGAEPWSGAAPAAPLAGHAWSNGSARSAEVGGATPAAATPAADQGTAAAGPAPQGAADQWSPFAAPSSAAAGAGAPLADAAAFGGDQDDTRAIDRSELPQAPHGAGGFAPDGAPSGAAVPDAPGRADEERHDDSGSRDDDNRDDDSRDDGTGAPPPAGEPEAKPPAAEDAKWKRPRGRDRSQAPKRMFRLAPIIAISAIALTGCSPSMWPEALGGPDENPTATPTSTIDQALIEEGAPLPAVNEAQLDRILEDARSVVAQADETGDTALLEARFTAAALEARDAVYRARAVDPALPEPVAFPAGGVVYAVPQATDAWPRTVLALVEMGDSGEANAAPMALMLVQESARDQYKVASMTQLSANVQLPEAAPITIGAPGIDEIGSTLVIAPDQLAAAYGDLILNGDASPSAGLFATENDTFLPQVGQAYRDGHLASIDQAASSLTFTNQPSAHPPLGVGTLDGGAIVAVSINEIELFSARTQLATLSVTGRAAALAGTSQSPYGFERIYTDQLLFYVPSAETGGQVQFLGYSQVMTNARQLDQSEVTYDS